VGDPIDAFLFTTASKFARDSVAAGAAGIVIDWERRGKHRRQAGADTQINCDTAEDLARVRTATAGRVLCRVDGGGPWSALQIDSAIALGADEVLLPMVRDASEISAAFEVVAGRCGLGILIETCDAVDKADELLRFPLSRVYVGLNDLMIDRGATSLFEPLVDGTVDRLRGLAGDAGVPFGVAGLTLPEGGRPVPCRLLAGELARVDADFTFLRRSFLADVAGRDLAVELPRVIGAVAVARRRTPAETEADRIALSAIVRGALAATAS
jgi:hypothetical protein